MVINKKLLILEGRKRGKIEENSNYHPDVTRGY